MRRLELLVPMLLAGCAHANVGDWLHGRHPVCDTSRLQHFLGEPARPRLARRMTWISRAALLRYVRPGMMTTREFRADRLTVTLDQQDRITAIRCG